MTAATVHSRLYSGQIRHRRHRDGQHAFTYPITLLYVDLDETGTLFTDVPFWSARRPAVGWLREKDYLANVSGDTLRLMRSGARFWMTLERTPDAAWCGVPRDCSLQNLPIGPCAGAWYCGASTCDYLCRPPL